MERTRVFNNPSSSYDLDVDEFGAETEAEKQMKFILQKQLNTKLSVKEQFSQHRTFVSPSTYKSLTELVQGTCSVDRFRELEKDEEVKQELQRCGLSEDEITDYLAFKSSKKTENRLVNPSILQEKVQRIEDKIKAHNEDLKCPQTFQNVKKLTRHEMDIEKSLYAGSTKKAKLDTLVTLDVVHGNSSMDDAYSYIKDLSDKLQKKCLNSRKKRRRNQEASDRDVTSERTDTGLSMESTDGLLYDVNIHHVVVPLEAEEVSSNRLSMDEIRKLPKFENYRTGEPNKVLYLKNLQIKTTVQELRSIFSHFKKECGPPIDYKMCTGRMKGQAFITFPDSETATKALHFANGFVLREKPIIIEFGKKT